MKIVERYQEIYLTGRRGRYSAVDAYDDGSSVYLLLERDYRPDTAARIVCKTASDDVLEFVCETLSASLRDALGKTGEI